MGSVWNDESKLEALAAILASSRVTNAKLMLFKTLTSIDDTTTYSTFASNEVTSSGYARQTASGWSSPAMSGHRAVSIASVVTFNAPSGSPSDTITGWALVDDSNSKIIVADLYATPFAIPAGDVYRTSPVLTFRGENNSNP